MLNKDEHGCILFPCNDEIVSSMENTFISI